MAKLLDAAPQKRSGPEPIWDRFCDGQVWEIELGVDVETRNHANARTSFSRVCKKFRKSGSYHKTGDLTAVVQAKPKRKAKR